MRKCKETGPLGNDETGGEGLWVDERPPGKGEKS